MRVFSRKPKQPAEAQAPSHSLWPIAVWLGGENLNGAETWAQLHSTPDSTASAGSDGTRVQRDVPPLMHITTAGLNRPLLVFGRHGSGVTTTLLRLLTSAAEDPSRIVLYVDGRDDPRTREHVVHLLHAFGRTAVTTIRSNGQTTRVMPSGLTEQGPSLTAAGARHIEAGYLALPPDSLIDSCTMLLWLIDDLLVRSGHKPATLILEHVDLPTLIEIDRQQVAAGTKVHTAGARGLRRGSGSLGALLAELPELARSTGLSIVVSAPNSRALGNRQFLERFVQADASLIIHATDAPEQALEMIVGERERPQVRMRLNSTQAQMKGDLPPITMDLTTVRSPRSSARLSLSLATGEARIATRRRVAVAQIIPLQIPLLLPPAAATTELSTHADVSANGQ